MINADRVHIYILSCLVCLLPSCRDPSKSNFGIRPLHSLIDYQETKDHVSLAVKKLDTYDCTLILGKRAARLFKKNRKRQPICPLQISLTNGTNKLLAIKPEDVGLPIMHYKAVAARLSQNSFAQAVGTIASSILIGAALATGSFFVLGATGLLVLTTGSFNIVAPLAILGSAALAAMPTFLIIGTPVLSAIRGVQTAQINETIRKDIKHYSLKQEAIVQPYQTVDMLVFISKPFFKPVFPITISNPENAEETIEFKVILPDQQRFLVRPS